MRILFDHGTPAPLRRALTVPTVSTAYEMGWAELDNGALLAAAESASMRSLPPIAICATNKISPDACWQY
jgi:hypothetical protein